MYLVINQNQEHFLEISDYHISEATKRMDDYPIQHYQTSFELLIEKLLEEIKPVITEKNDIEYGDEANMLAHLDSSDNQNFEAKIATNSSLYD